MYLQVFLGLVTTSLCISSALSYGTIVEVYPSTCPALPTGPAIPPTQNLLTVLPGPVDITSRVESIYITANGSTTADCSAGAPFTLTNGQLSSNGHLVSTTGLVPFSSLAVSPSVGSISTTFLMVNGSNLAWNNTAFAGGHALFCMMGDAVEAVFNGQLPAGCAQVYIGHVPVSSCPTFNPSSYVTPLTASFTSSGIATPTASVPGTIQGVNVTATPLGCLSSTVNSPAISASLPPKSVTTLEQCADSCSNSTFFGVQSGLCVCGDKLSSSAMPAAVGSCNIACTGNSAQSCGGAAAMVVYSIVGRAGSSLTMSGMSTSTGTSATVRVSSTTTATTSSMTGYVTSTGVPNCYDRSPFDRTVNDGYLILCNTALPGFDIMSANGSSLAECISRCNAFGFGNATQPCVAVSFDITASSNQCRLKSNITVVDAGADELSEAAVLVAGPYAPNITFASVASTATSTTASTGLSSSTATVSSTLTNGGGVGSNSASASTSSIGSTSMSQGPRPTVTNPVGPLCPTYNGQVVRVGGYLYQVECSTEVVGQTLEGNVTTAASLAECGGYCNLFNLAVPFGCVGVTFSLSSASKNCFLKSRITGTQYTVQDESLRLIYPGYPSPTDPILTASLATMGSSSSATGTISTRGTTSQTSSSTGPTATAPLCPAYNYQTLYFPSYGGSYYEIECSTTLLDTGLAPVIATSLTDCINQCSFLNLNTESPQCIGVTYRNTAQTSPPSNNCNPKGSITTVVGGVPEDDSARLIWQGYPSGTNLGAMSTPTRTLSSTSQTSSGTTTSMASSMTSTLATGTMSSTLPSPTGSVCPTYNFQIIQAGSQMYEVECGYELLGHDIGLPYSPYPVVQTFQQCLAACNYWNENTATPCIAADFLASENACYLKDTMTGRRASSTFNAGRLIYSAYPSITDAPGSSSATTLTVSSSSSTRPVSSSSTISTTSTGPLVSSSAGSNSISGSSIPGSTPTANAAVYPAEPVCPSNNGGQLTSQGSNLYDIECNVDLRYSESNLPSTGVSYAATFSACAAICDQYNLNVGAQSCRGFTWDSTSTSTTATNCVLKSAAIQTSTANTANIIGVHSGRFLGPWPSANQVILSKPIPLVTNTLYSGYDIGNCYASISAPGGLNWQITNFSSPTLYVGNLGFVSLSDTNLNTSRGLGSLSGFENNNDAPYALPSSVLPKWAVALYWSRGLALLSSQQGIYYQIDTIEPGRYYISIEFYYIRFTTNNDLFHWITTYDTGNAAVWTSYFFESGEVADRGAFETVGHQGTRNVPGQAEAVIAASYENGVQGSVLPGDKMVFNTNPGVNTVVRTPAAFNVAAYSVPGAWSYTNSPM
ncbi:hypothetical protein GJ744_010718 [Endocarpon pusillum]|uniref:WSC domain-containing protein n=1 Tax=Endocarpon pusillum TaxID=364733 RepID=A0A8H7AFT1_9EURO|nr:hypothetical protein GJ744_010718 [Endocarpon pusillum]